MELVYVIFASILIIYVIDTILFSIYNVSKHLFLDMKNRKYFKWALLIFISLLIFSYTIRLPGYLESEYFMCKDKYTDKLSILSYMIKKDLTNIRQSLFSVLSVFLISYFLLVKSLFVLNEKFKYKVRPRIITFIFVYFILPFAFLQIGGIGNSDRAKISSVKANMHTLQTLLETYSVDNGVLYPESIINLKKAAKKGNYWKEIKNPFDLASKTYMDMNFKINENNQINCDFFKKNKIVAGMVIYYPVKNKIDNNIYSYYLYGTKREYEKIDFITDGKNLFYLSNY